MTLLTVQINTATDDRLTFGELEELSQRVAANLLRHGCNTGRPVAVCMSNCIELVVLLLAVWRLGTAAAVISAALKPGTHMFFTPCKVLKTHCPGE